MKRYSWHLTIVDGNRTLGAIIVPSNKRFHTRDIAQVSRLANAIGYKTPITIINFQRLERLDNVTNQS